MLITICARGDKINEVLKAYNDIANEVVTIEELEQKCKVLKLKVIKETHIEIIYKRFCGCALMGKDKNIHTLRFYVLDVGKIDRNGDVENIVPFEYGLL